MTGLALPFTAGRADNATDTANPAPAPSFLERIGSAIFAAQRRRAEKKIAFLLAQNGGQLTDDLERQISRQFGRIVE